MSNEELAVIDMELVRQPAHMPVMNLDAARERWEAIQAFVSQIMREGEDYGRIPGGTKPTLLKSGAEKLCSFFGLAPEFDVVQRIERWDDKEPFFHYETKCRLVRDGKVRGEGLGSCNSRESKYRYRVAERKCPACGNASIIKGREEYGGGWVCFAKKGGCNAKFRDGDPKIEKQETGRIPNPDIADVVNTILKMAKKRALIDAVLNTVGASQFFSQDVEDLPAQPPPTPPLTPAPATSPRWQRSELESIQETMTDRSTIGAAIRSLLERLSGRIGEAAAREEFDRLLGQYGCDKWEALGSLGKARQFAGDLYGLVQQAPEPFDEEREPPYDE